MADTPVVALQISDQLLAKNPRDADAWTRFGNALSALGRTGKPTQSVQYDKDYAATNPAVGPGYP